VARAAYLLNVPLEAFADQLGTLITCQVANVPRCDPERSNGMLYTLDSLATH
jgi:hypothetical protein